MITHIIVSAGFLYYQNHKYLPIDFRFVGPFSPGKTDNAESKKNREDGAVLTMFGPQSATLPK